MKEEIEKLRAAGLSQRQIAAKLDISRRNVRYHLDTLPPRFLSNLVFNDQHRPFQDDRAVDLMLEVGKALNPDIITINGDNGDCWAISRFTKREDLRLVANLKAEIDDQRAWLKMLRGEFPDAEIKYIFGNHEYRWDCYIQENARELSGLKGLTLAEQLELAESDIKLIYSGNRESSELWGKLLIGHFDRVSKHSSFTAKLLVEDKSISLIQAHTHRGGAFYKRMYDRDVVGYENFCLCDLNPCYTDHPNWQLGFSIVYKQVDDDFFYLQQHPIIHTGKNYRTFFDGQVYET